ncbi:uncharacterized protein LOC143284878 [Babylonia areolata]|uniref:uncharacterized protein LOC143284878 n=1 Tax=Babylonia areolata TaxID=304850 RepID=UPI003FD166A8
MAPLPSATSSSSKHLLLVALTLVLWVGVTQAGEEPSCPPGGEVIRWLEDPDDCSKYYVCYRGQRFDFDCGDNVWSQSAKTCVTEGSRYDKCSIAKELDNLKDCSNSDSAVFAKADNCAQYYDCSSQEATVNPDPHVVECVFPFLFNANTKQCENYTHVKCGDRPEPKNACEYEANQCRRSHCIPCHVRFPSCKGLPDGLNPWVGRDYSPFYVLCLEGRVLFQGRCEGPQLFDPEKRMCADSRNA